MAIVLGSSALKSHRQIIRRRPELKIHRPESFALSIKEDGDEDDWLLAGTRINDTVSEQERTDSLPEVRWLAKHHPNVKRALVLYKSYILGRDFSVSAKLKDNNKEPTQAEQNIITKIDNAWIDFLRDHRGKWSLSEFGERTWRDGEQFTRMFDDQGDTPQVRFIDPVRS
jgi:capsid protein